MSTVNIIFSEHLFVLLKCSNKRSLVNEFKDNDKFDRLSQCSDKDSVDVDILNGFVLTVRLHLIENIEA